MPIYRINWISKGSWNISAPTAEEALAEFAFKDTLGTKNILSIENLTTNEITSAE